MYLNVLGLLLLSIFEKMLLDPPMIPHDTKSPKHGLVVHPLIESSMDGMIVFSVQFFSGD